MDSDRGGTPADGAQGGDHRTDEWDELWEEFEQALAVYLSTMVDPDERDHLVVELPDPGPDSGDGCPPYAQFAAFGEGHMIRAEISGDSRLAPHHRLDADGRRFLTKSGWAGNEAAGPEEERNWHLELELGDAEMATSHIVRVLRTHFGIAHPHLLTYQAWGPAAEGASVLGLCASDEVPVEQPVETPASPALALMASDRDELVALVGGVLQAKYDEEPEVDDDGDFVLAHEGQLVWVRVRQDQPAVEIMARVAHDVRSRRATAVELGLLNRDNLWVHWVLRERMVWQTLMLPAFPFVPAHLDAMLDLYLQAMTETRDDLVMRTGARVA